MEKTCKSCGKTKTLDQFHKDKSKPDGLNFYCKPCVIQKVRMYSARPPRHPAPEGMKRCCRCKETKTLDQFHKSSREWLGVNKYCKACSYELHLAWAKKYPEKAAALQKKWRDTNPRRSKDHKLKGNYGIPLGTYEKMFEEQSGRCKLCGTDKPGGKGDFHIDHCHDKGHVRGLLCHNCNVGIGNFHHDISKLELAISYIKKTANPL
jgi:Recombination endonuclease VII